jgi:hypothetical protein
VLQFLTCAATKGDKNKAKLLNIAAKPAIRYLSEIVDLSSLLKNSILKGSVRLSSLLSLLLKEILYLCQ